MSSDKGTECLMLKAGAAKWAAYFETRRYAAYMGATTEVSRWEGWAIDAAGRSIYGAMTIVAGGMKRNDSRYDNAGNNDINVAGNDCGCVYKADVDANWSITRISSFLCGKPLAAADKDGNRCDLNGIASPDNLAFQAPNMLYIYEVSGSSIPCRPAGGVAWITPTGCRAGCDCYATALPSAVVQ